MPACGYRAEDMTDDDVDVVDEYFHSHTSAEVCANPSAEGFFSGVRNSPSEADLMMAAAGSGP